MDSTKQLTTLSGNKWITFRKVLQPDQSFQSRIVFFFCFLFNSYSLLVDVISGRHIARVLVSRSEDIRFYGNGIVYPISTILSTQPRTAADELSRNFQ